MLAKPQASEPLTPHRPVEQPSPTSLGPVLVDYECPSCQASTSAPLRKVAVGPVGYWCCQGCDRAFRVRVNMESIEQDGKPIGRRRTDPAEEVSPTADPSVEHQLLQLYGEELQLRSRLAEIFMAVEILRDSPESS